MEDDPSYPYARIQEAIRLLPLPLTTWLHHEASHSSKANDESSSPRRKREAGEEFQVKLCRVDTASIRPRLERRAEDASDPSMYNIINLGGVVQRVVTRVCSVQGRNTGSGRLLGTEHWCRQEYTAVPLAAVPRGSTTAVIRRFLFPSGCSCYLRHDI